MRDTKTNSVVSLLALFTTLHIARTSFILYFMLFFSRSSCGGFCLRSHCGMFSFANVLHTLRRQVRLAGGRIWLKSHFWNNKFLKLWKCENCYEISFSLLLHSCFIDCQSQRGLLRLEHKWTHSQIVHMCIHVILNTTIRWFQSENHYLWFECANEHGFIDKKRR